MNFNNIIQMQKNALEDLEKQLKELESRDYLKENEKLQEKLNSLEHEFTLISAELKKVKEQNTKIADALYEQTFGEKLKILDLSRSRLQTFFGTSVNPEISNLQYVEKSALGKLQAMRKSLAENTSNINSDLLTRLNAFTDEVRSTVKEAREENTRKLQELSVDVDKSYDALRSEQISKEQIIELEGKNSLERFFGLKVLNIVGILLIVIGTIAAGQFVQARMSDGMRTAAIFLAGVLFIFAGELLNRRRASFFSLGITAGGVAISYVGLVIGHFLFDLIPMFPALGVVVLITAIAFILATRYKSQTLLIMAFVGGYLPIFSISATPVMLYGAMVYFIFLNLLDILTSFRVKWKISAYFGLFFNILSTAYIILLVPYDASPVMQGIVFLYVFVAFFIYTAVPIISNYLTKSEFSASDALLLGINTIAGCITMYAIVFDFGWNDRTGLLAVAFAGVYLFLGLLIDRLFKENKTVRDLFYITGIVFVILIVPFQFGMEWITLGWLIQGTLIAVYGIIFDKKTFRTVGILIFSLCICALVIIETGTTYLIYGGETLSFLGNYSAVTAGSLIILISFIAKGYVYQSLNKLFKYLTIINFWIYLIYLLTEIYSVMYSRVTGFDLIYLLVSGGILITLVFGFVLPRLHAIEDDTVKLFGLGFYSIGKLALLTINFISNPIYTFTGYGLLVQGTLIAATIFMGIISLISMYDFLKRVMILMERGLQYLPVIMSAFGTILLTQILIMRFGISFSNMWLSFIYAALAFAWIIFGFNKKFMQLRRFGLALALLSVGKLFLIDLAFLNQGLRIISYFVLGAVLVAISFVYQYFSKRMETGLGVALDAYGGKEDGINPDSE